MQVYKHIGAAKVGRSVFNLSYEKKLTCDMGQLIPIMCDEVVPGDIFNIGNQIIVRFQPLVAPVMHEINCYVHYFFVPYRLLWSSWEDFISGGVDGDDASVLPRWEPTVTTVGSLWDYLGFPTGVDPDGAYPMQFPMNAYNFIYNEYYRDETLIPEVALDNELILNRCWEKDYFTSAQIDQQRGTPPALPLSGTTNATWANPVHLDYTQSGGGSDQNMVYENVSHLPNDAGTVDALESGHVNDAELEANVVDFADATTFTVADLRLAFQIQKWQERNQRAGVRYREFLLSHFGVTVPDSRLQRPEYIGGSKAPLIISEVLQTSETTTGVGGSPQGNMAGHGVSVNAQYCGKYRVQEYGLIMGIMSIMPKPAYQQGIDRQWLRRTRYDFPFPEFVNLSEQAIEQAEIFATDSAVDNTAIFGYQGRYDEMRVKKNMVVGEMRTDFDYWHLGRIFPPAPDPAPTLDDVFVTCDCTGADMKRIFAVQDVPGLMVTVGNLIKAIRPIPVMSNPGLIDH